MEKMYVVKDPSTDKFVVLKEGMTGFYELDESKSYDADYAASVNEAMGNTEEDLEKALARSMFGTW